MYRITEAVTATSPFLAMMPFFLRVRIACVLRTIVIFWPSTKKVFFCRLGLNTRLVRRKEKLTLLPNCFPLPVSSHRATIVYFPSFSCIIRTLSNNSTFFGLDSQGVRFFWCNLCHDFFIPLKRDDTISVIEKITTQNEEAANL